MINNVVLVGRLTKDVDLRYTASGLAVGTFTLAVNRNFSGQDGKREADFISCVIWRKPAENLTNYAKKGSLIGITGRIQTRNYENQQGQQVYVTEVVADQFQLLDTSNRQKQPANSSVATNKPSTNSVPPATDNVSGSQFLDGTNFEISDNDLPF